MSDNERSPENNPLVDVDISIRGSMQASDINRIGFLLAQAATRGAFEAINLLNPNTPVQTREELAERFHVKYLNEAVIDVTPTYIVTLSNFKAFHVNNITENRVDSAWGALEMHLIKLHGLDDEDREQYANDLPMCFCTMRPVFYNFPVVSGPGHTENHPRLLGITPDSLAANASTIEFLPTGQRTKRTINRMQASVIRDFARGIEIPSVKL